MTPDEILRELRDIHQPPGPVSGPGPDFAPEPFLILAMLLAILMPEVKSSLRSLFLALGAGALNTLLIAMDFLPKGWTIIVCILVVSTAGALLSIKYPAPEVNHG